MHGGTGKQSLYATAHATAHASTYATAHATAYAHRGTYIGQRGNPATQPGAQDLSGCGIIINNNNKVAVALALVIPR